MKYNYSIITEEKEELNIQVHAMEFYRALAEMRSHLRDLEKYHGEDSSARRIENIREAFSEILSSNDVGDFF